MPKRGGGKLLYSGVGTLLVAGVIVVIVLAALGYFNKKGGSPSPGPAPGPSPIPANITPPTPILSNFVVQKGTCTPSGCARPTGLSFNINAGTCFLNGGCSLTLNVVSNFPDGTTTTTTKDITGFFDYTISFTHINAESEIPSMVTVSAFSTMNGISSPSSTPYMIPIS